MPRLPRVVIVGAGLTGCALADELSQRGWTNITVLEQGALPHAGQAVEPEPLFRVSGDKTSTELTSYTATKYRELTAAGQHCFRETGSLEITTSSPLQPEIERSHRWARSWGVTSSLLDPASCAATHPLLAPRWVTGGLYVPGDGLLDPVRAAMAQASRAAQRGVRLRDGHTVTAIGYDSNRVRTVHTDHGDFRAEIVVVCAGKNVGDLAAMTGLELPVTTVLQLYVETTPLPEIPLCGEDGSYPLLRHSDTGTEIQQCCSQRLGIRSYLPSITTHDASDVRFRHEDFEPNWQQCLRILPGLSEVKVETGEATPFAATPDGNPLLGEHYDIDGLYFATAVPHTQSAGATKALAEWLVEGQPGYAVHTHDLHRFDRMQRSAAYIRAHAVARLERTDSMPRFDAPAPPPLRTSPFYERQIHLGARFTEIAGWACPLWYARNETPAGAGRTPVGRSTAAAVEARLARERVALFDLTARRRVVISGPEAWSFLQTLTTNSIPREPGSVCKTLLLTEEGGVRAELNVVTISSEHFQLACDSYIDVVWLHRQLPPSGKITMREITSGSCAVGLCGPSSTELLRRATGWEITENVTGSHHARRGYLGAIPVLARRSSYPGEPGWELSTSADMGRLLWDTLRERGEPLGMLPAGSEALRSLRMETGQRDYGIDVTAEHDPFEAGMAAAVRMDKGYFLGREGLIERLAAPATRRLVCLSLYGATHLPQGAEPVCAAGSVVGYITSAEPGYTTDTILAYAWLDSDHAELGASLEVDLPEVMLTAEVAPEPVHNVSHHT